MLTSCIALCSQSVEQFWGLIASETTTDRCLSDSMRVVLVWALALKTSLQSKHRICQSVEQFWGLIASETTTDRYLFHSMQVVLVWALALKTSAQSKHRICRIMSKLVHGGDYVDDHDDNNSWS